MKIPEKIRIGGREYKVQNVPNLRNGADLCYGLICWEDGTIALSETDVLSHDMACITLWHEILHGIINHAAFQVEEEEQLVEVLSKGIYQVLQDNEGRLFPHD